MCMCKNIISSFHHFFKKIIPLVKKTRIAIAISSLKYYSTYGIICFPILGWLIYHIRVVIYVCIYLRQHTDTVFKDTLRGRARSH